LNEHVRRLLRAIFALVDYPVVKDVPGGPALAQSIAEKSIVRLKNEHNLLPLGPAVHSVVVIGGDADKGIF
jgi:beta-glucosidase